MADPPIASVVIPAHNEVGTIGRGLALLLDGAGGHSLDVVVVANACTDRTAEIARASGARVIETPVPGKAHALRLGDALCLAFPRLYLDADVEIDFAGVQALVAVLREDGVLACAPVAVLDLSGAGPVVRRVHRVHDAMIGPHRALAGVGLYAVDRAGHDRIFPLPDVIADDEWVHRSFAPAERRVVDGASTVVRPAPTVRAHLDRRARVRLGNQQLAEDGCPPERGRLRVATLGRLVREGTVSPVDAGCYLAITTIDRVWFAAMRHRHSARWLPDRRDGLEPHAG